MKDNLKQLRKIKTLYVVILILLMSLLLYNDLFIKSLNFSIFIGVGIFITLIFMYKISRKEKLLEIKIGIKKIFDKGNHFNYYFIMSIILAMSYIILGISPLMKNFLEIVFRITLGIIWFFYAFIKKPQYYLEIDEKYISKLDTYSIDIKKIIDINYMNDKVIIKEKGKLMNVYYDRFNSEEKDIFLDELKNLFKNHSSDEIISN